MVQMKPKFSGVGMTSGYYDGPPPVPGTYQGEVSHLGLGTIQSGANAGEDKLIYIVKITHGKFKGAEIFGQLLLLTQNAWSVNQFLHAMTDGSEKQKEIIEKWFWELGWDREEEMKHEKLGYRINYIGKPKFVPIGKPIGFTVTLDGERAQVSKFNTPLEGSGSEESAADATAETAIMDAEVVETVASVASEPVAAQPVSEPTAVAQPVATEAVATAVAADDDDDPWG